MSQSDSIIWKPVSGLETRFMISNTGIIKSLPSLTHNGCIRKLGVNNKGYAYLSYKDNGKMVGQYVHRLVAKTFIPNPYNKPLINHKDSNPLNNHVDNLEWCTQRENMYHAEIYGNRKIRGSENCNSKLTDKDVIQIINRRKNGETRVSIARDYHISDTLVGAIYKRTAWKHLKIE